MNEIVEFSTQERLADAEQRIKLLENELSQTRQHNAGLRRILDLADDVRQLSGKPPPWAKQPRSKKAHVATANLLLSDWHFDATIFPDEIEGANCYDRTIATKRLRRCVDRTVYFAEQFIAGVDLQGLYVFLAGDIVSGTIHDELKQTNAADIMDTVAYWVPQLESALAHLADKFGQIHVAAVVGNHGRTTRKPVAKHRAQQNFDWLLYKLVAEHFAGDSRFTFDISDAADTSIVCYDHTYLLTHGDQFRGGNGIAGIWSALMLGTHRKTRRQATLGNPFNQLLLGHFHQYVTTPLFVVNGSGCGYDEYAYQGNLPFEPPQQAFWLCTPEHGPSMQAPIYVADRKQEGW